MFFTINQMLLANFQFRRRIYYVMKRIFFLLVLLYTFTANAQNTISPYSIFGPGEIQNKGLGATLGLGGAGIALKSGSQINNMNPASYTGIDSSKIIAEFGMEGKWYNLATSTQSQNGFTANFKYLALGFRVTPWLSSSLGVIPFSSIGYSIQQQSYINGINDQYTSIYNGSGGITQFYIGNAIKITKNLSIGIHTSYMFGALTQDEKIKETPYVTELQITRQDFLRSLYFDYGLLYSFSKKQMDYSLGLTFSNKQSLKSNHNLDVFDKEYRTIRSEEFKTHYLTVPLTIGAGISVKKANKYNVLLDYNFQKWSGIEYPIQKDQFTNSHRVSLGVEFNPWEKRVLNTFYKNWDYRVGFNYKSSYLKFGSSVIRGGSFSFGAVVPLPGRISEMNWGFEIGSNGTNTNKLMTENYVLFQIGFSLNEIAFIKRKFD